MQDSTALTGGFAAPAQDAARAFRACLTAMARPGMPQGIAGGQPPAGLSVAAGSLILTLCDPETVLWLAPTLDSAALRQWVTFHTGAPFGPRDQADFAIGSWGALAPLSDFRIGTPEYPDRSATLIVEGHDFNAPNTRLRGPGIKDHIDMALPDLTDLRPDDVAFPLGLDFYFAAGDQLAALPRSTRLEAL